ncbi:MAG: L-threonylcarbamoyladenylate synthase [Candidatus Wallbacteria bacterium]|nr:L-threonylcarbamoyladenylate synthase [Candidatus Wallbacteria bacterium]
MLKRTVLLNDDDAGLEQGAEMLRSGGLVAFPTETVFGLGACAFNCRAVAGIFEAKGRPTFDPLIVHVAEPDHAYDLWDSCIASTRHLCDQFWPGPLTIINAKSEKVPDLVTAGLSSVAVRCPDHETARELITRSGMPVAAPSANRFGRITPTTWEAVMEELDGRIDAVIKGVTRIGLESTVVRPCGDELLILRPGAVTCEELRRVCPVVLTGGAEAKLHSPGHSSRHYAPTVPMRLFKTSGELSHLIHASGVEISRIGVLLFCDEPVTEKCNVFFLSPEGDLRQAAARLFPALRFLESCSDLILAQVVPATGLGEAINDRLNRASFRNTTD